MHKASDNPDMTKFEKNKQPAQKLETDDALDSLCWLIPQHCQLHFSTVLTSSFTIEVCRFLLIISFVTNRGASNIMRNTLDRNLSRITMLELDAGPKIEYHMTILVSTLYYILKRAEWTVIYFLLAWISLWASYFLLFHICIFQVYSRMYSLVEPYWSFHLLLRMSHVPIFVR